MRKATIAASALLAVAVGLAVSATPSRAETPDVLRVGLVDSIFRDVPKGFWPLLIQPFSTMLKTQANLKGEAVIPGDAHALGQQLNDGKVHFGVFHGIEFGWAREKYP